jgi:hypothetical protein
MEGFSTTHVGYSLDSTIVVGISPLEVTRWNQNANKVEAATLLLNEAWKTNSL